MSGYVQLGGVCTHDDEEGHGAPQVMPHPGLAVVPGAAHGLFAEKPDLGNALVLDVQGSLEPTAHR